VLALLSLLVPRPLDFCGGAPEAVLWSLGYQPTLIIDDAPAIMPATEISASFCKTAPNASAQNSFVAKQNAEAVNIFVAAVVAISGKIPPLLAGRDHSPA